MTMTASDPVYLSVLADLRAEYKHMRAKHGEMSIDGDLITDAQRLAALGEEFGEVCRALTYDKDHAGSLRAELIDVANVAVTWAAILKPGQ